MKVTHRQGIRAAKKTVEKPSCKENFKTRLAARKQQKLAELLGRGLDQLNHLEGTLSNLWSCLQAVTYASSSQLL